VKVHAVVWRRLHQPYGPAIGAMLQRNPHR
jgi:hypothetical protein